MADTLVKRSETGIGAAIPRLELQRLLAGKGRYVDDIKLPRMLHAAFVRSPHAHALIRSIDLAAARQAQGVTAVLSGRELNPICEPFVGVALHRPGHRSPPQPILPETKAVWQGQPVAIIIAESRALAEDAAELVEIDWEPLPVVLDQADALAGAKLVHDEMGDNVAFDFTLTGGDVDDAFAKADIIIEEEIRLNRQTALTLETRGLVADFNSADGSLTVWHAHQSPFQMQGVFSRHLRIPEHKVRVIAPDIGGAFGMKLNIYMDEIATVAASVYLRRPIKLSVDRLEAFVSDAQARDHVVSARMALARTGEILGMDVDDVGAVGAYGMPLRFNVAEGMMTISLAGAPYDFDNYRGRTRSLYVNKPPVGLYRGVGMPIACIITELLADRAADALGIDPLDFRRRNYHKQDSLPCQTATKQLLETVSFHECLEKLAGLIDYDALRREQAALRSKGVYRGIGIATFVEQTAYGPPYYGPSQAPISTQDGCSIRLEPSGALRCVTSTTDQGQGTLTGLAQIISDTLGMPADHVSMISGDSTISPYGGGAWASRGIVAGGEAALKAAMILKDNILKLAATISQTAPETLDLKDSAVIERASGRVVITLADVARIGYFRQDTLPPKFDVQLAVSASHAHNNQLCYISNGVQASYVDIDVETGLVKVLRQWAVDDCGRIINPLLVDEQVRGGIAQGIGAVLFEECAFDDSGNLVNGTLADYLLPTADTLPDIAVAHVETLEGSTRLGAKGIGEAGLIGAMGAVWLAVNDALKPFGASIRQQPFTPERILDALEHARLMRRADA